MPTVDDITIIGGGPVGLFGLYHSHLRQLRARLIDSLPELGGQVVALYPEKYIFDVGGFPKVTGRELIELLAEQSIKQNASVCLGEKVVGLERDGEVWRLQTSGGEHLTRSVVIAAGLGAFNPRKLGVPGEEEFAGRGVQYFVRQVSAFYGKRVLIVGGGDSAVDWANTLIPHASIRVVHNLPKWQAHEESVEQMRASGIPIGQPWELREIRGADRVEAAVIGPCGSDQQETIAVDEILICIGFSTDLGPIKGWGLPIRGGQIQVDWGMKTPLEGVFAAGDVVTYPGKTKLIALGFGEVGMAVDSAVHYLFPEQRITTKHSSDRGF
ncbi:MAG: NAD(P)/FAD-dependent oxidoreductase [Thermaerobacter sp.]|nr:NAD(P)/FAD-dependent oxidoreductase [Thermaerobacter sp.]